jgi:hypothetical protein
MLKFIGLANWFRNHVEHHSTLMRSLEQMVDKNTYRKNALLKRKLEIAFKNTKEAIHTCPKLFFLDRDSPITLYTDASDNGIGASLT